MGRNGLPISAFNLNATKKHRFYKDNKRDWEICYEPIKRSYLVQDRVTGNLVSIDENKVEKSMETDKDFNNLIQHVDNLLRSTSQSVISQISSLSPLARGAVPLKDLHRRTFGVPSKCETPLKRNIKPKEVGLEPKIEVTPYLEMKGFHYSDITFLILKELPFSKLNNIRKHFIDNMESSGFQGAIIERTGKDHNMEIYFANEVKAAEAVKWILDPLD